MMQKRKIAKVPIWLRKLSRVKAELRGEQWPLTPEEGFQQGIALMALAFQAFTDEIRAGMPGAKVSEVQAAVFRELARLGKTDARWVRRWKIERARFF